ncbi:hypothetical protein [Rhodococcus sp. NPDC060176]|uniref:hypothetical protein n=1 Tax=Rhodococcus sp. NPDC060176 TaxID=3347062 RepID=UPI00366A4CD2
MSHSESSDTPQIHGTEPVKDTSKPGWIARTVFGTIGLAAAISFLTMGSTRTTIAGIGLIVVVGFHFVAAFTLRRQAAKARTAAVTPVVDVGFTAVVAAATPLASERAAAQTKEEALAEIGRGDWASVKAGLGWFVENAAGEQDWLILAEGLRFPSNLAPREIAAEALIKRYGTEGLYECLCYLDSDDLEGNAYWHIESVFEELYLVDDIPIRTMLLEISTTAKYNDQKAHADELLDTHNLSVDGQGVLKKAQ